MVSEKELATGTGTSDKSFDVISVLYHALQGSGTASKYAEDARGAGDEQLAAFFQKAHDQYRDLAEEAKGMLKAQL